MQNDVKNDPQRFAAEANEIELIKPEEEVIKDAKAKSPTIKVKLIINDKPNRRFPRI